MCGVLSAIYRILASYYLIVIFNLKIDVRHSFSVSFVLKLLSKTGFQQRATHHYDLTNVISLFGNAIILADD